MAATADQPWQIEWHSELPSTMTRARDLAKAGAPAGTVIVANYQTDGRGTHGRNWLAPPDTCLMFTLIVRLEISTDTLTGIPLRVSESIAACLREEYGIACEVKPPNDIMVAGKKLCGVLCTSHLVGEQVEWLLIGIGLNTRMSEVERPFESATSLAIEGIDVVGHSELLSRMLNSLRWLLEPE